MYDRVDLEKSVILSKKEERASGELILSKIFIDIEDMTYRKTGSELTYEDTLIVSEIMKEFTMEGALERGGFEKVVDKEHHEVWSNEDGYGNRIDIDIDGSDVCLFIDGWGRLTLGDPKMWRIFWSEIERRVKDE